MTACCGSSAVTPAELREHAGRYYAIHEHAAPGATADVTIEVTGSRLRVCVTDTGSPSPKLSTTPRRETGHGLVGIGQRATLYDGTVTIGPRDNGQGWIVQALLDLSATATPGELVAMTTVLIADDQPLQRMGFRMLLEGTPGMTLVGEAATGAQAVRMAADLRPDVVLQDIRMPGVDGVEATRRIVTTGGCPRVWRPPRRRSAQPHA